MKTEEKTVELPEVEVTEKTTEMPGYVKQENTFSYVKDGKKQYATEDKLPELFPEEYKASENQDVREQLLKQKYQFHRKGDSYIATDKKQEELNRKAKGLADYTPRKSAWDL